MHKLALIHNFNQLSDNIMHLLINRIDSRSLRKIAASLRVNPMDHFLESMITAVSANRSIGSKLEEFPS